MMRKYLITGTCICMSCGSLLSCRNVSNEQGRETADTASDQRLQEGPQSAHSPLNKPENRSAVPDSAATESQGAQPGGSR